MIDEIKLVPKTIFDLIVCYFFKIKKPAVGKFYPPLESIKSYVVKVDYWPVSKGLILAIKGLRN